MSSIVVVGTQWGDEGKGKIVDYLAERADVVARFQGGCNAGHTVVADGKEFNYEAMVGRIVGPVSVCKTNHHAGAFAMSSDFVKEVKAKTYLSSVWQAKMVDHKSLSTMCSRELYPGDRIVWCGDVADSVRGVVESYGDDIPPVQGHTVIKVAPGGDTYRVFVVDASDESMRVMYSRRFDS